MDNPDYFILSDGGTFQTNPGDTYGSYRIRTKTGRERIERCRFGHGTSNTAEYNTLITALGDVISKCEKAGTSTATFTVECITDSQLVVKQVNKEWGCYDDRLVGLRERVLEHLRKFKEWRVVWQPREEIMKVLGH